MWGRGFGRKSVWTEKRGRLESRGGTHCEEGAADTVRAAGRELAWVILAEGERDHGQSWGVAPTHRVLQV